MTKAGSRPPPLATIGYEGSTIAAVLDALRAAGVRHLIDVRAVPLSRKPGFSRRQLAAALDEAGIVYVNLRALGTPAAGRQAARRGDTATMHRIFAVQLATPEAQDALAEAVAIARARPACLLCFEHDPDRCHRRLVAEAMRPPALHHLRPMPP